MYKDLLLSSGLSDNEAIVYEFLLKSGKVTAGEIIKKTPLKRGVIYNTLSDLVEKDLVTENKIRVKGARGKNIVSEFAPNHPGHLRNYLEGEKSKLEKAEKNLEANISSLVSDFSLVSGRPGVRYFEGEEGVRKVLEDTLTSKTEILTIADIESIRKYAQKINEDYVENRNRAGIGKRLLALDSEYARKQK
jgi:sugar-specific transcriptional regulator TrmB